MSQLPQPRLLSCADATGAVYDQGAHVTDWIPTGHAPVLWLSPSTALEKGSPIRGGVPICFPWFADGASGGREPKHGFARTTPWHVETRESSDHEAVIVYRLHDTDIKDPAHREQFPHRFEAEYSVRFGPELLLQLNVTNTDDHAFDFEEALHAYLVVGDVHRVRVEGLDGAAYRDKVLDQDGCVQEGELTPEGEVDRVYESSADVAVVDPVLGRVLRIRKTGSQNTVVWNPWAEKAAALPDVGADGWTDFVCVEGANVGANAVRLEPGQTHSMGYRVSVETTPEDPGKPPA
ncbi:D-hexose-6-phosphate mutarotase [Kocuria dechangensis]|uniref:Putative glucose-6-phosphate 1-epimerase n=1 Tax=Kocuria dechangensis TaxID=1176249 RepID=A0A917GPZ1_9MICC|nr:D-hexose-6-phosphate mutarotase [Kocuria dechangensis]GGG53462.1 D-hexose-6-phosphate mutarotase [Kocuria dechangensis]